MLLRRTYIPQEEVFLSDPQDVDPWLETPATSAEKAQLQHELLQKDVDLLRVRLDIIRSQVSIVAKSGVIWANASARSQLGSYPWLKFAAVAASSFAATNALRKLPFGSIAATALPVVTAAMQRRAR